jgi:predicted nucleic acid-binding protein
MIAFDSNVLIYASGLVRSDEDEAKMNATLSIFAKLSGAVELFAPVQVLGEVYHVCKRKGFGRERARDLVLLLQDSFTVVGSGQDDLFAALDLATDHQLQIWDALIINVAASAGCSLLLSEDMQDGFAWRGVTVVNPFAKKLHKRLARVLAG